MKFSTIKKNVDIVYIFIKKPFNFFLIRLFFKFVYMFISQNRENTVHTTKLLFLNFFEINNSFFGFYLSQMLLKITFHFFEQFIDLRMNE